MPLCAECRTVIVVPCYNESARLNTVAWNEFAASEPTVSFLFVNDGSTDETCSMLESLCARNPQRFSLCDLPQNRGKAEAVRQGILHALQRRPTYIGYWDADLATPLKTISTFATLLDRRPDLDLVMGARVRLLGHQIKRSAMRHCLGRVFATAASRVLGLPVYDTQCGAKLFRVSSRFEQAFARPFRTNWTFDVEVLARLTQDAAGSPTACGIYEYALTEWRDVPGSKVRPWDFIRALAGLMVIAATDRRPVRILRRDDAPRPEVRSSSRD